MSDITNKHKEFKLSSASIKNSKMIFLITIVIVLGGLLSYKAMPKEFFPEIEIPDVYVSTPYPGGNSKYIRDKITEPFETELNSVKNVDKISSTSSDGFSMIKVSFDFKVSPDEARDRVQRAVDQARTEQGFPQLQFEPNVFVADVSDMPILNVNLSSNKYSADQLEVYAKLLKAEIKNLSEVSDVEIRGVPEKKVIIELNRSQMTAKQVSFQDIENAINSENVNLPSGDILFGTRKVTLKIDAEFKDYRELDSLIVKSEEGNEIYLNEITDTLFFGDADATSFARQYRETVVMLDIKKRAGSNLLDATDEIKEIVAKREGVPSDVDITITNEQAAKTRDGVSNLENSIIFGVLLVTLVLLFFLGLRNAVFVGIAIPLSMYMSYMILHTMGVTMNVMVLFASVMALGMLVDNGIVVVENIYRLKDEGMSNFDAAKYGVGEVAWPIIASTATTLAAFIPLGFWPGMMGQFFKYLPLTLIVVLGSSLFIALVINPVFTSLYMKLKEDKTEFSVKSFLIPIVMLIIALGLATVNIPVFIVPFAIGLIMLMSRFLFTSKSSSYKAIVIPGALTVAVGLLYIMTGLTALGNGVIVVGLLILLNKLFLAGATETFQNKILPWFENGYRSFLTRTLKGRKPVVYFIGMFVLLFMAFGLIGAFPPNTLLFPENEPNYLNIYIEHPVGTDIYKTDETTRKVYDIIEKEVYPDYKDIKGQSWTKDENGKQIFKDEYLIKSIISQVGKGTSDPASGNPGVAETPHKARITVQFAEAQYRQNISTADIKKDVEDALDGRFPAGVRVIVDKNMEGPPQEPPINIEVSGPGDYSKTLEYADSLNKFLNQKRWLEKYPDWKEMTELKMNVETDKLELPIELDKKTLRDLGTSTYQVASLIRTALFGKDISTYKYKDDSYDINMRLGDGERNDLDALMSMEIVFRNTRGKIVNIPVRSLIKQKKNTIYSTYGSVKRKEGHDLVTVQSNLKRQDKGTIIVSQMKEALKEFEKTDIGKEMKAAGYTYKFTGGQEEQAEQMSFLGTALAIAVFLILIIIVAQFNSYRTPVVILLAVLFSFIGVLLGLVIFRQDFVIMMTMIGIISLAGIVVNNAIVLIDYTNLIRLRKRKEMGLKDGEMLPMQEVVESIIEGGQTRLRPVLLTAITTVLGLIPLATGFNINFVTLFTDYDPQIFFGGDNAIFFGPMSWTIIYGLSFATFLTLVIVPVTYLLFYKFKLWLYLKTGWTNRSNL